MKKIFILQPYLAPYRVGLFNEIDKPKNVELHLIYFSEYEKRRKWNFNKKYSFKEYQIPQITFSLSYEKNLSIQNIISFLRYVRKEKPDVIVASANIIGYILSIIKKALNYKLIIWQESTEVTEKTNRRNLIIKWMKRSIIKSSDNFIVPGLLSHLLLKHNYPFLREELILHAPNSVDDDFEISIDDLYKKYKNLKRLKFYYAGSLTESKGVDILYVVFKKIIENANEYKYEYELNIMGDGDYKNKVPNSNFKGFLNGNEYINSVKKSHVFILPSRHDCNPLTIVEAIKAGNIVITTDAVGNYPEFVKENGFIIRVNNARELKNKIEFLLKAPQNNLIFMAKKSLEISKNVSHKNSSKAFLSTISRTR